MKQARLLVCLLLSLCMICALCACSFAVVNNNDADTETLDKSNDPSDTDSETETETIPEDDNGLSNFKRLKRVAITYQGQTNEYDVVWEGNDCRFESPGERFSSQSFRHCLATFNEESKVFSLSWKTDDRTYDLPVFLYDDQQKIIGVYDEDHPDRPPMDVTYNEHNVPVVRDRAWFDYNGSSEIIAIPDGGGASNGVSYKWYQEISLDEHGNYTSVAHVKYTDDGTGNFVKTEEKPDYKKYTYDEGGNLIRYEEPYNPDGVVIVYEYSDQSINHLWERVIPICYIEFFEIYETPFLWYLN